MAANNISSIGQPRCSRCGSMSKFLRERKGWIELGVPVPKASVAERISKSTSSLQDYDEIPADVWFTNGVNGFDLLAEEALSLRKLPRQEDHSKVEILAF